MPRAPLAIPSPRRVLLALAMVTITAAPAAASEPDLRLTVDGLSPVTTDGEAAVSYDLLYDLFMPRSINFKSGNIPFDDRSCFDAWSYHILGETERIAALCPDPHHRIYAIAVWSGRIEGPDGIRVGTTLDALQRRGHLSCRRPSRSPALTACRLPSLPNITFSFDFSAIPTGDCTSDCRIAPSDLRAHGDEKLVAMTWIRPGTPQPAVTIAGIPQPVPRPHHLTARTPSKPPARLDLISPRLEGPCKGAHIDAEHIDAVIRSRANALRFCYERELQTNPDLAGQINLSFRITNEGRVAHDSVAVTSADLDNRAVERCILQVTHRLRFQPLEGDTCHVTQTLTYRPAP